MGARKLISKMCVPKQVEKLLANHEKSQLMKKIDSAEKMSNRFLGTLGQAEKQKAVCVCFSKTINYGNSYSHGIGQKADVSIVSV